MGEMADEVIENGMDWYAVHLIGTCGMYPGPCPYCEKPKRKRRAARTEIEFPATILVDSGEQLPYTFQGILSDAKTKQLPYKIRTERFNLFTGDYSLAGYQDTVTIERKSPEDLIGSVIPNKSNKRRRAVFQDEVERMNEMVHSFIVVESEIDDLIDFIKEKTSASPKSIIRTWMSWMIRYPRVHWCFVPGRRFGEVTTFRILNFIQERSHNE